MGQDRRPAASVLAPWLALMLDEIDHGMLLLSHDGELLHANQPGRLELARGDRLVLTHQQVRCAHSHEGAMFSQALADAHRGRRRLLWLGGTSPGLSVAVVPLASDSPDHDTLVLLMLGRRPHGDVLTIDFYARTQHLTEAETRVLRALCRGLQPKQVALEFDVAVSTVRTQISSIRHKTQTTSIRDLLSRVSDLPPIAMGLTTTPTH